MRFKLLKITKARETIFCRAGWSFLIEFQLLTGYPHQLTGDAQGFSWVEFVERLKPFATLISRKRMTCGKIKLAHFCLESGKKCYFV